MEDTETKPVEPTAIEDLEKQLAEAEAKRAELLKARIDEVEKINKELSELDKYNFPQPTPTKIEAIKELTYEEALEQRFTHAKDIIESYPMNHPARLELFPKDEMAPNGLRMLDVFWEWYNHGKKIEEIIPKTKFL